MRYDHDEQPVEQGNEYAAPITGTGQPLTSDRLTEDPSLEAPISEEFEPDAQSQAEDQTHRNLSRRKLLIAGAATTGLVIATSLGFGAIELKQLLQGRGTDVLGSLRLGSSQGQHQHDIQQPLTTPQDIVIFAGRLSPTWQDWSWGQYQIVATPAFTDGSSAIKFSPANGSGLYFSHDPLDSTGYGFFQFWVNGGAVGGQQLLAGMADENYNFTNEILINDFIQGGFINLNQWRLVRIPMASMQSADNMIGGVIIRDASGTLQPDVLLADLRLVYIPDLSEPSLLSGNAPDLNAIVLFFDRQMRPDEVQTTRFYEISSQQDSSYFRPLHPARVQQYPANKSVSLYVPQAMYAGKQYVVSVGRIHSMDGPALPDASNVTVTAQALALTVDITKRGNTISPYIYGVNAAPDDGYMTDLRPRLNRWGGESTSRYNWKLGNAFNAGSDYYFQNGNYERTSPADRQPSGVADQFIQASKDAGVEPLLTIPAIGWVAKDDLSTSASLDVPFYGGPPIQPGSDITWDGYDPTANRRRTSVPSRARKGQPFSDPPSLADPTVAQDEWIYHLVNRFGSASNGGVRFYAIDNEPELWCVLHRDIRPVEITYDQSLAFFLDYATAIKDVDPSALITGPTVWGWPNYFYSALDRGVDNFKALPDYHAHHDTPFLIWWMQQIRQHDEIAGRRSLDVLDIHFFPPGLNPYDANPARNAVSSWPQRLRSTRLLWDPSYKDEFWINDYVYLIPQMHAWIAQSYPGTKLAISEYTWGGGATMNAALAQAEVLGIIGREGVELACYWPYPAPYDPTYYAFKLYSNYDSQEGWFHGTSLKVTSTRLEILSGYAVEQEDGSVLLMVLNKDESNALTPTISLPHLGTRWATVYQYGPDIKKPLAQIDAFTLKNGTLHYTFPPYSITLLKLQKT